MQERLPLAPRPTGPTPPQPAIRRPEATTAAYDQPEVLVPGAPAELTEVAHTRATTTVHAVVPARSVAGDAVRLVAKDLGGQLPRTPTRRVPAVPLDEVERVHPAEQAWRATLRALAVP